MKRIIWHWTAGGPRPTDLDRSHYHFLIDSDGQVHSGLHPVEANENPRPGQYAAHTRNCNTGSIGVSLCGMLGAQEAPFSPGRAAITELQIDVLAELTAQLCAQYGIPVTRETVLSHAEVQPTLGIAQRGKWDIAWLPGDLRPRDPVTVGDELRGMVRKAMGEIGQDPPPMPRRVLRIGVQGSDVRALQRALGITADGYFGPATKAAVEAFQISSGIGADGIVGPQTWSKLEASQ